MQRIECRIDIRNEELRRKGSEQRLSIGADIRRDLRALPDANLHRSSKINNAQQQRRLSEGLTFFNSPRTSTGSIFKLSETANWALAPAPAAVILPLYALKISANFCISWSLASSSL